MFIEMNSILKKYQGYFTKKADKYREIKKQRGMTLLEIIIVLGIIGTIAAGVVILAQRAFDSRAISDMVSNTNTVRIALKDAYQRTGNYPAAISAQVLGYDADTIKDSATSTTAIARLVQLGKISVDEARNGISNDYLNIGGAITSTGAGADKGFVIELNGLDQTQCRSIISQVGNNWDFVSTVVAPAGSYTVNAGGFDMTVAAVANPTTPQAVLRSLDTTTGSQTITAPMAAAVCSDDSSNGVILGSR
ncbi:type IV pilus major pilin [Salmonella enterica]|uniref:type IV pilus major pilin n=1 Tax=Salmonella enterica TaxID=28901 RepID=UPI0009AD3B2C|nr:type IV pilus major pilin [Salmonella enterica]ECB7874626.1 type IV pilus major pilin [Salmonella enterica subsp. enterica serovar Stanley]EDQ7955136.1 type IV pilus major pilin [Salmonella enterica subsp. enterica serovar Oslo]EGS9941591.1 type IV pilus major pilin [Salmonella enterica]EHG2547248.1 type IV pilus major pilin [Salmonella enterica]